MAIALTTIMQIMALVPSISNVASTIAALVNHPSVTVTLPSGAVVAPADVLALVAAVEANAIAAIQAAGK